MKRIKHSANFNINAPADQLFPLFSAEGEKLWVPGWDYENIMNSTRPSEDYVFITKNHDHASTSAIWIVKKYEPQKYNIQFYKIEPDDKIGIITVKCIKIDNLNTNVEVVYEYVGLSKNGEKFIEGFTAEKYEEFIGEWNILLKKYFNEKC